MAIMLSFSLHKVRRKKRVLPAATENLRLFQAVGSRDQNNSNAANRTRASLSSKTSYDAGGHCPYIAHWAVNNC